MRWINDSPKGSVRSQKHGVSEHHTSPRLAQVHLGSPVLSASAFSLRVSVCWFFSVVFLAALLGCFPAALSFSPLFWGASPRLFPRSGVLAVFPRFLCRQCSGQV